MTSVNQVIAIIILVLTATTGNVVSSPLPIRVIV